MSYVKGPIPEQLELKKIEEELAELEQKSLKIKEEQKKLNGNKKKENDLNEELIKIDKRRDELENLIKKMIEKRKESQKKEKNKEGEMSKWWDKVDDIYTTGDNDQIGNAMTLIMIRLFALLELLFEISTMTSNNKLKKSIKEKLDNKRREKKPNDEEKRRGPIIFHNMKQEKPKKVDSEKEKKKVESEKEDPEPEPHHSEKHL